MYALLDINSFFASCERIFRPDLAGKPIVVLSNNDGCIIARTPEAKKLGIPMGAPFHEWKEHMRKNRVHVFSSNYKFYGDISARVMNVISNFSPEMEIYSIDEAFLDLHGMTGLTELAGELCMRVEKWVGVPVTVGVAATKTLAKVANRRAKKLAIPYLVLENREAEKFALIATEIEDVWGVGRNLSVSFRKAGIGNAHQLATVNRSWLRGKYGVTVLRMAEELAGTSCFGISESHDHKKSIISSRSFGRKVTELRDLKEAAATYTAVAAEKLRKEGLLTNCVMASIRTSPFDYNLRSGLSPSGAAQAALPLVASRRSAPPPSRGAYYKNYDAAVLANPTDDTAELTAAVMRMVERMFIKSLRYHKCGVVLTELSPKNKFQPCLTVNMNFEKREKRQKLMQTMDKLNERKGKRTVFLAATGTKQEWIMRSSRRSPEYTTKWSELPIVRA